MKISKKEQKQNTECQYNQNCVNEIIKGEISKKENFTLLLKGKKEEYLSPFASYRTKANFKPKKVSKPYMKPIKKHPFIIDYESKIKLFYRTNELQPFHVNSFQFTYDSHCLTDNDLKMSMNTSERYQVNSTEAESIRTERVDKRNKINLNIIELLTKEKLKAKNSKKKKTIIHSINNSKHIMIEDNSSKLTSYSPSSTTPNTFFNHSSIYNNLKNE